MIHADMPGCAQNAEAEVAGCGMRGKERRAMPLQWFKRLTCLVATLAVGGITSVRAEDSMNIALELGTAIGSEAACGLTYDQRAIERFINEHVNASDMSFPSTLNMMTMGTKVQIEQMSKSSLTAHCTQVRRIAEKYGFTK
jgi:hypothetical protein